MAADVVAMMTIDVGHAWYSRRWHFGQARAASGAKSHAGGPARTPLGIPSGILAALPVLEETRANRMICAEDADGHRPYWSRFCRRTARRDARRCGGKR